MCVGVGGGGAFQEVPFDFAAQEMAPDMAKGKQHNVLFLLM